MLCYTFLDELSLQRYTFLDEFPNVLSILWGNFGSFANFMREKAFYAPNSLMIASIF